MSTGFLWTILVVCSVLLVFVLFWPLIQKMGRPRPRPQPVGTALARVTPPPDFEPEDSDGDSGDDGDDDDQHGLGGASASFVSPNPPQPPASTGPRPARTGGVSTKAKAAWLSTFVFAIVAMLVVSMFFQRTGTPPIQNIPVPTQQVGEVIAIGGDTASNPTFNLMNIAYVFVALLALLGWLIWTKREAILEYTSLNALNVEGVTAEIYKLFPGDDEPVILSYFVTVFLKLTGSKEIEHIITFIRNELGETGLTNITVGRITYKVVDSLTQKREFEAQGVPCVTEIEAAALKSTVAAIKALSAETNLNPYNFQQQPQLVESVMFETLKKRISASVGKILASITIEITPTPETKLLLEEMARRHVQAQSTADIIVETTQSTLDGLNADPFVTRVLQIVLPTIQAFFDGLRRSR
ncbi:hypothetical protein CO180_03585 [candidate division WWE3 bacterium CG_4_9_14_3_um_filter_41_6]|nr:MAG: hypothetical protein CO180_03585 [candidate division WWE3 bacterium CG_4_9_14_3_um_filter_41_6]